METKRQANITVDALPHPFREQPVAIRIEVEEQVTVRVIRSYDRTVEKLEDVPGVLAGLGLPPSVVEHLQQAARESQVELFRGEIDEARLAGTGYDVHAWMRPPAEDLLAIPGAPAEPAEAPAP